MSLRTDFNCGLLNNAETFIDYGTFKVGWDAVFPYDVTIVIWEPGSGLWWFEWK